MTRDNNATSTRKLLSSPLTHYEVLAVSRNATLEEIKAAHRQLALQCHPDKVGGASSEEQQDAFLLVQKAWECLRSSSSRQDYDEELSLKTRRRDSKRMASSPLHLSELQVAQDDDDDDDDEESTQLVYIHVCRCGDEVQLWQEDVPCYNKSIVSECPGCSFCYSITNDLK
jgi:hypothetical protein